MAGQAAQRGSSPQKPYGENLFASSHSKETLHFEKLSPSVPPFN